MILGIDIGTQSTKAVLANESLEILGEAKTSYGYDAPQHGWAEPDPGVWERALAQVIAKLCRDCRIDAGEISAVGLGGQLDGCIAVDCDNHPLHPALIWMDRRAQAKLRDIDSKVITERAGLVCDATHMAAKIRWLQVQGLSGLARYHQPVSYLVARLTGRSVMDHGLASTTMLYSLADSDYDPQLLELFDIPSEQLPAIDHAWSPAGHVSRAGAALSGLKEGTLLAVGTGDDFSAALGAGLTGPGKLNCIVGTAEVVGALHEEPLLDRQALVETHAYPGGFYYLENPGWISGGAVAWFQQLHALDRAAELDALATKAAPGSEGVAFLPALSGSMTPEWHSEARGAFYGLSLAQGREQMARAVLEAMAFAMRDVLVRLQDLGLEIDAVRLSGGGAKSPLWNQIRANVAKLPVEVVSREDTSPLGALLLAGKATGLIDDLASAAAELNPLRETVTPVTSEFGAYDEAYDRYRRLFRSLKPLFEDW
jgi:xylulokinase